MGEAEVDDGFSNPYISAAGGTAAVGNLLHHLAALADTGTTLNT